MTDTSKQLLIIGAGPKAMAIASKNRVLSDLGFRVPRIHIIERRSVGANWTGDYGYTNGRLRLGTSPEKDVGFPYHSSAWGDKSKQVDQSMQAFSWQSYLVATGKYSEWVDRGRPAPEHRVWASYLQWVSTRLGPDTEIHAGDVRWIGRSGDRWQIRYREIEGADRELEGTGLVLTGPGQVRFDAPISVHDRLFDAESFWRAYPRLQQAESPTSVAIVGTGETAASIAMALVQGGNSRLAIDIVCPGGMTFSRGESYRENRVYSNPEHGNWDHLSEADRHSFITRTDRGVFSQYAHSVLDHSDNIRIVPGNLEKIDPGPGPGLTLRLIYSEKESSLAYDYIVLATGADLLGFFKKLLDPDSAEALRQEARLTNLEVSHVEGKIDFDLGVEGLSPRLHLPMLSGIRQGPGFANLSCLGRLSDRVLSSYVEKNEN